MQKRNSVLFHIAFGWGKLLSKNKNFEEFRHNEVNCFVYLHDLFVFVLFVCLSEAFILFFPITFDLWLIGFSYCPIVTEGFDLALGV